MLTLFVSSSSPPSQRLLSFSNYNYTYNTKKDHLVSLQNYHRCLSTLSCAAASSSPTPPLSTSLDFNPLRCRYPMKSNGLIVKTKGRGFGTVCYAGAVLTTRNLQWISTVSSVVLMLARGTAIQKSFIVPLFALQAPASVISWIKGDYGVWTAFVALLVRLFFFIPGELELPFVALLLVFVAPYQVMNLRGTQAGAIIALVVAAYLAFQHFSRTGSLQKAFDQGSIVATLAIICISVISCLLFI